MTKVCEASYPPWAQWAFEPPLMPVHALFENSANAFGNRPCLTFMGQTQTYAQVMQQINQAAEGLQNLGVQKGTRLGLCLPNTPYYPIAYYAALKVGATVVNFNPLYTQEEIAHQIKDSAISHMVTLNLKMTYDKVAASLNIGPLKQIIVCPLQSVLPAPKALLFNIFKRAELAQIPQNNFHIGWGDLLNNSGLPTKVEINAKEDIALLQYTGGTTGTPKGAMLTHQNVVANALQSKAWVGVEDGTETFLGVLPFFHVFAMTAVLNLSMAIAANLVMMPRFDLKELLKTMHATRPTFFGGVPTIFAAINTFPKLSKYNLSSLKHCISGGASLPAAVQQTFKEKTGGATVVEGYGLSEASPVIACNPLHSGGKNGAAGLPFPGTEIEARDLEDISKPLPAGQTGEIFVRGPQVMKGYWNQPEATAETLIDGWLRTGDVGHVDEEGYLFLTDRLKEIIIINGYNVYPRIIEEALYKHNAVEEVIVIGIDHAEKGQTPKAFVKLKQGQTATEEELLAFAASHLNPIEKPTKLEIRDNLPKTLIGKLSKKELITEENQKGKS